MNNGNQAVWVFFDSEDMNRVVHRLAAAGWASDVGVVNPEMPKVQYSSNGALRMRELSFLLMPYSPTFFGISQTTPQPESPTFFDAIFHSPGIAPELIAPPLSERERWAFIELLSTFAKENLYEGQDEHPNPR